MPWAGVISARDGKKLPQNKKDSRRQICAGGLLLFDMHRISGSGFLILVTCSSQSVILNNALIPEETVLAVPVHCAGAVIILIHT